MTPTVGVLLMGAEAASQVVAWARAAEEARVGALWVSEDCFYPSAVGLAAAAAVATSSIPIGLGVVNPFTRHPALIAMEAATLGALAGDRVILGLGTSNRHWIETQLGIEFRRPLQALRETVEIVRRLWGGERLSYPGACYRLTDAALAFRPSPRPLPVYLGMKSPRGLALAGEIADGVLLSALTGTGHLRRARGDVARGRAAAGRTDPITVAAYVAVSIDRDSGRARDQVREMVAEHLGIMHGQSILADAGLEASRTAVFHEHLLAHRPAGHLVTDDLVDRLAIAGTPRECREALRPLAEAGLDLPIAMIPPGLDPIEQTRRIAEELAGAWDELRRGRR